MNLNFKSFQSSRVFLPIKKNFSLILAVLDALISVSFFILAYHITKFFIHQDLTFNYRHYYFIVFMIPTLTILMQITNLSEIPRTSRYRLIFFDFIKFSVILATLCFLFVFIFKLKPMSRYLLSIYIVINHFGLFFFRILTYRFFKNYRISGYNFRNVLIIADDNSISLIDKIKNNKEWGFRILSIITNSEKVRNIFGSEIKIYPNNVNLKSLLDIDIVDEVIYCKTKIENKNLTQVINLCQEVGITFRLQTAIPSITNYKNGFNTKLEGIPVFTIMNTPNSQTSMALKTISESVFAFFALLALSPFLLFIASLIRIETKGPVFFKQKRVGLRGRQFYIYKFRTMVVNAEEIKEKLKEMNEADGPTFKIKKDPRITRIGSILRTTSIDEVPQLINVLKGEMALIGPRPPIPEEVKLYKRWQLRRLSVKPGLTCTWQITPNRNEVLFDKWVKLDLNYIDNWSLKKDVKLFFKTIRAVFVNNGY